MEPIDEISRLIKAARTKVGLSAKAFAEERTDWSYFTYRKWEAGQSMPNLTTLQAIAKAVGAMRLDVRLTFADGEVLNACVFEQSDEDE